MRCNVLHALVLRKKNVFSNRPRTDMMWTRSSRCLGSEFYVIGPATQKAWHPYKLARYDGTTNRWLVADAD